MLVARAVVVHGELGLPWRGVSEGGSARSLDRSREGAKGALPGGLLGHRDWIPFGSAECEGLWDIQAGTHLKQVESRM